MPRHKERDHTATPLLDRIAGLLHKPKKGVKAVRAFGKGVADGRPQPFFVERLPFRPQPCSVMEKAALAMELGASDHGQVIFQTHTVREPPHRPGRADEIPELVGAIQRSGVVVDVVMNVLAVCVSGNEKGVLALCPAHRRFVAYPVCLFWGNLARLERLADLIAQHIGIPPLLPARGGLVLSFGEQKLRIGCHVVTLVGGNQFAALRLVRVLPIVKPILQGLGDGFPLADLMLLEIGCGRRQPSFRYDKRRLFPAAARTLGQVVPKSF